MCPATHPDGGPLRVAVYLSEFPGLSADFHYSRQNDLISRWFTRVAGAGVVVYPRKGGDIACGRSLTIGVRALCRALPP